MKLQEDSIMQLGEILVARNKTFSTAESCTGGLVAALCTSVAGSSTWFKGGVVSYSNDIKEHILGVRSETLASFGAVSAPVVEEMVAGACQIMQTDTAIAISGIAGPGGGTKEKPVGTVWIATQVDGTAKAQCFLFEGDRQYVREQSVYTAIEQLLLRLAL